MGVVSGLFQSRSGVWVRDFEHVVLRIVSLGFSLASANAIRWFFLPLDGADRFQPIIGWMVAVGFGALGYFVSRGLAHRLMNRERIWLYLPICLLVEFVEIVCNFGLAASMISEATWLHAVPTMQRGVLEVLTYAVLSVIPLVSLLLAVVDMDMARQRLGPGGMGPMGSVKPMPKPGPTGSYPAGNGATYGGGVAGRSGGNGATYGGGAGGGNGATYGAGYSGAKAAGAANGSPFAVP